MARGLKDRLDYSDILATPDDGKRYEILDGDLFVTPSPRPQHQRVSRRLQRQLEDYFHARSIGEVFNAPIDVILTQHDVVVPDLVVVGNPDQISRRGIEQAPLLVVEVLSPSTQSRDRGVKSRRYAELGVRHYWIVDLDREVLECYRAEEGTFQLLFEARGRTEMIHPDFEGLCIDLERIW